MVPTDGDELQRGLVLGRPFGTAERVQVASNLIGEPLTVVTAHTSQIVRRSDLSRRADDFDGFCQFSGADTFGGSSVFLESHFAE